ncbi:AAA family ATPase [Myxococcota bacterium]|nr:AAA family ATPase [Myxococcota bacterium]
MTTLAASPELDESRRDTLAAWRKLVEHTERAWRAPLRLGFIGQIGMGKSSLIAAAMGLHIGPAQGSPRRWSVLPIGDGNTTLGELRVKVDAQETQLVLRVEPVPAERLAQELTFLVEDTWRAARRPPKEGAASGGGGAGEELYDLLRMWLTGGDLSKRDARDLLKTWVTAEETLQDAVVALKARVDLNTRSAPYERRFPDDEAGLTELKSTLAGLMKGTLADAPAPAVTTLSVPQSRAGVLGIDAVIDTQGLEPTNTQRMLTARPDLMGLMDDPSVMLVVCADYTAAPDGVALEVLKLLKAQARRWEGRGLRLLLVDKREETTGAEAEDHRFARIDTCAKHLRREELDGVISEERVLAIDVRREHEALRGALGGMVDEERSRRAGRLQEAIGQAEQGLEVLADVESAALRREIDMRLWWAWEAHVGVLRAYATFRPLNELGEYILRGRPWVEHWSHIHATIRRRGRYHKLDLAKVLNKLEWEGWEQSRVDYIGAVLGPITATVDGRVGAQEVEYLNLRMAALVQAMENWHDAIDKAYFDAITAYFASPEADELWADCLERWGQGPGYVNGIAARLILESERVELETPTHLLRFNHEDALPPRPPMLSLAKVSATNFRNIVEASKPLSDTTVIIGENGKGKTAWLEAIAKGLEAMLPGLGASAALPLRQEDVRHVTQVAGERTFRHPVFPMSINLEGTLQGKALRWSRQVDGAGASASEEGAEGLTVITQGIAQELLRWPARPLPVLAYYGTQRLWPPDLNPQPRKAGDRLEGYRDCLVAASTHQQLLSWVRDFTFAELQQKRPVPQLRAIRDAVLRCVEGTTDFFYDIETESLVLTKADGDRLPFAQLSDGVRNIVALVADIAWRASVLNPQLGERAPALAEGVVLIDEIDLHLHPKWQRHVRADLRAAFPRIQIITTTHSPFIIQSLEPGQLVNLDPNVSEYEPYADESPEDIAEHIMGVPVPQRSQRRAEAERVAAEYFELLERVSQAEPEELARVKARLDKLLAPYNDNPAFVAYTNFLERKRLVAEGRRP